MSLLPVLYTAFGIQALGFAIAAPLQTDRFYDLTGSLTYAACIGVSVFHSRLRSPRALFQALSSLHTRQIILSVTTLFWCGRLGSFLAYRITKDKKDSRFDKIKQNPMRFGVAWFLQGVWCFLTAYPVYFINVSPAATLAKLGLLDVVGLSLWTVGFAMEAFSDWQKLRWAESIGHERRKNEFISHGLWSLSRHPNYFGEILLWFGSCLIATSGVMHFSALRALSFAASPIFVAFLLNKVSGIPLLEKSSDKRFGHLQSYQDYKSKTPVLVPNIFKIFQNSNSKSE